MAAQPDVERVELLSIRTWYPGQEIEGLYRIDSIIAHGGMGIVYKATDLASNQAVIIKSLLPQYAVDTEYKSRFIREAEEWVRLGYHPNIVRAYTVHEIDYLPRIIAEYIDGGSLYELLHCGAMELQRALRIAVEICWAIAHAHDKGLIHRDLKPGNILLTAGGQVKVTDFGLAKRLDSATPDTRIRKPVTHGKPSHTDGLIGTPEYIAPEQWRYAGTYKSDIYSFGIMLYELFCGARPFQPTTEELQDRLNLYEKLHLHAIPADPLSLRNDLPEALAQLLRECIAKDPDQRPQDFRAIGKTLQTIAQSCCQTALAGEPDINILDRNGRLDQANAYMRLGIFFRLRGEYEKATRLFKDAFAIFEKLNVRSGMSRYYLQLGLVTFRRGQLRQAQELLQHSIEIADTLQDHEILCRAYHALALLLEEKNKTEQADASFRTSLRIAEVHKLDTLRASLLIAMTQFCQRLGRLTPALAYLEQCRALCERMALRHLTAQCSLLQGQIHVQQGYLNQAVDSLRDAVELYRNINEQRNMVEALSRLGHAYNNMGDTDMAVGVLHEALDIAHALDDKPMIGKLYSDIGEHYLRCEETRQATDMFQRALALREETRDPVSIGESQRHLGCVAAQNNNTEEARKWFELSLRSLTQTNHHWQLSETLFALSELLIRSNERESAKSLLKRCRAQMRKSQHPLLAKVEAYLTELKT